MMEHTDFFPLMLGCSFLPNFFSRAQAKLKVDLVERGIMPKQGKKSQNSGRARCVVIDVRDGISPVGKICILCEDRLTGNDDSAEPWTMGVVWRARKLAGLLRCTSRFAPGTPLARYGRFGGYPSPFVSHMRTILVVEFTWEGALSGTRPPARRPASERWAVRQ